MTTWIKIDAQELVNTGIHLRDVAAGLVVASERARTACCSPGLGRHAGSVMNTGDALSGQLIRATEAYLHLAIDTLQRAILTAAQNSLVSAVGTVGTGFGTGFSAIGTSTAGAATMGGFGTGFSAISTTSAASPSTGTGYGSGFSALHTTSPTVGGVSFASYSHTDNLTTVTGAPISSVGLSGYGFGGSGQSTADLQIAAAVRGQQISLSEVYSGVGNPTIGRSQSGLVAWEQKFGSSLNGISVKERFGS